MITPWTCGCGALNTVGLLRCPRCRELSPQYRDRVITGTRKPRPPRPARRKAAANGH